MEDGSLDTVERVLALAQHVPFRRSAVRALGCVLQGELGKLPEAFNTRLQDAVLALYNNLDEDLDVRRRALEAIANCGREGVKEMIQEAYNMDELPMRVSAVYAMGRSCDAVWTQYILDELSSDDPELRFEAARAAGELELQKALPRLIELAYEDDREIGRWRSVAGRIGGSTSRKVLSELAALAEDLGDEELADAVAEAQSMATMAGQDLLPLFDFSDYEDEDLDELDLDAYDEDDYEDEDEDDGAWDTYEGEYLL